MAGYELKWRPPGPVAAQFVRSKAFIRGIRGPIGSGKSATCVVTLFAAALAQAPGVDGVRRTRWAIIRNTYPELKSTTIKTWLDWFPEDVFGRVRWDVPITQVIKMPLPDGTQVEAEVLFLSCDIEAHVKKLLSLELTGAWINEARELPYSVFEALTGRIGRYPSQRNRPTTVPKSRWPTQRFLLMDTNSPKINSWWYRLAERKDDDVTVAMEVIEAKLRGDGVITDGVPLMSFFTQPSGTSPGAENVKNLAAGYYELSSIGKSSEWISVHVANEYGVSMTGKRVFTSYSDHLHLARAPLMANKALPLMVAFDFGRTPAFVCGQLTPRGQLKVLREIWAEDMSLTTFLQSLVLPLLGREFPSFALQQMQVTGDPAGDAKGQNVEASCESILRGIFPNYRSAYSNLLGPRLESVKHFLERNVDGDGAFRLDPSCTMIREAMLGEYHYRKISSVEERLADEPDKNKHSHISDALQYLAMLAYRPATQQPRAPLKRPKTLVADGVGGY